MYINSVHLENIRCIERLDLAFEEGHEAGWHVLIGENGSGKTTVARAIALGLVGKAGGNKLVSNPDYFLKTDRDRGTIKLIVDQSNEFDQIEEYEYVDLEQNFNSRYYIGKQINQWVYVVRGNDHADLRFLWANKVINDIAMGERELDKQITYHLFHSIESIREFGFEGWFVSGFGPVRRFKSSNTTYEDLEERLPWAKSMLSLFRDDASFSEVEPWIQRLYTQSLEGKNQILQHLRNFINNGHLLPNEVKLNGVTSDGVFFHDSLGNRVSLHDLSDGYRSVLSLAFELIRQLLRCYGEEKVFANIQKGDMNIPVPGVVIIDEVDAHLHPTWQTKIGQWFTRYFPNIQFIVTSHSPLICRACGENGKIFRLAAPGSKHESGEITGVDRDRLVYGDILAAYETDAFGDKVEWGQEGRELQREYRDLAYKRRFGVELTDVETAKYERLKAIFRSHVEAD